MVCEPIESDRGRFLAVEIEETLQMLGCGMHLRILKSLRAPPLNDQWPGRWVFRIASGLGERELRDGFHETGFAKARFSHDEHHLARALLRLLPAIREQAHLRITSRQRREQGRTRRIGIASSFGVAICRLMGVRIGEFCLIHRICLTVQCRCIGSARQ